MRIVDTHTHVVSPDVERYPLQPAGLPGRWYVEAPHDADELAALMDDAGVARAVLVQGVGAYSYDNRYAADAASAAPERFWSACCVDPEAPDAAGTLRRWVEDHGMVGVRFFALSTTRAPSWLAAPEGDALWEAARDLGVHAIVTLLAHQLDELSLVLERHPDVSVSLDHCGFPPLEAEGEAALAPILALAGFETLRLKVTTHVLDAARATGGASRVVERLVEAFGAERVMWGSDFCQTHDRPYAELVALAIEATSTLSRPDRAQVLATSAESVWDAARARRAERAER